MRMLRTAWHRRIGEALEYLKKLNTPVAKTTLDLIQSNEVRLFDMNKISRNALKLYLKTPANQNMTRQEAIDALIGLNDDDIVYINTHANFAIKDIALTVVHECNHFLNKDQYRAKRNESCFQVEMRAMTAEFMAAGKKPIRSYLWKIAQLASCGSEEPMPENLDLTKPPKGIYVRKRMKK